MKSIDFLKERALFIFINIIVLVFSSILLSALNVDLYAVIFIFVINLIDSVFEDLKSFGTSFDFVMNLKPHALQLGFLKILHGTVMEAYAKKNGWQWMQNPVYETFSTPYMTYQD